MKLSVIIPCYNELNTIGKIINKIKKNNIQDIEIIVVDDFSTDGTREKLKNEIESSGKVNKILYHEKNKGKGAALRTGFNYISGDIVIIQDADLEYNPDEYEKLIGPIINNKADVVYGSRFVGGQEHRVLYFWHKIANNILTLLSNIFTNLNLSDMETCYKVFRKDIIKKIKINENRFGFEPEITAKVAKLNCRIYEIGISYSGRTYQEGKKIGIRDAFIAIYCIIKYNLFYK